MTQILQLKKGYKMKIKEIMTKGTATCHPDHTLADVGKLMKENDCGIIPVIDENKKVQATITDRDICLSLCDNDQLPSALKVKNIATKNVFSCHPEDTVENALKLLKGHKIRRLPVTDSNDRILGIVSLNDIILSCAENDTQSVGNQVEEKEQIFRTIQSISEHLESSHIQ